LRACPGAPRANKTHVTARENRCHFSLAWDSMRTLSPLSLAAAPLIKRSGSRTLLRRLAVPPPTRTRPRDGATSCPPASPPVIREEATEQGWGGEQPELRRSRRGLKEQQSTVLGALVSACLAVLYWCLGALGLTARARAVWDAAVGRVRTLRAGWAARLEAGTKMGRALSSAALDALGRGVTKAEKVSGFMRRAMSLESKMDTQGAIRAYQVRRGARALSPPLSRSAPPPPFQAASDLVPDDVGPLLGLAKCISDRGAREAAAWCTARALTVCASPPPASQPSLRARNLQERRAGALYGHPGGGAV